MVIQLVSYKLGPSKVLLNKFIELVDKYEWDFSELSDMAKATILELGNAMFLIDRDYTYNYENKKVKKEDVVEYTVDMLEDNIIPILVNRGYQKK